VREKSCPGSTLSLPQCLRGFISVPAMGRLQRKKVCPEEGMVWVSKIGLILGSLVHGYKLSVLIKSGGFFEKVRI
jgi:hypothetical protein